LAQSWRSIVGRILIGIVCLVIVAALGVGAAFGVYRYLNEPPSELVAERVTFEVQSGESARAVGKRLEEAGIIKSQYLWSLHARLKKEYIKAGMYQLSLPATQEALYAVLVEGRQILVKVTIPEGITLKKIAHLFAEAGICEEAAFLSAATDAELLADYAIPGTNMEGFLYPDTYFFPPAYPAARVVRAMADEFFARVDDLSGDTPPPSPAELYEKVIIASIVEREYRVAEEAAIMAGVFYNRLHISMPLQSCATVEYVITEIQGKPHPDVIFTRDTEIEDPYNTYVHNGLPPGPIAAPGAVALNAALHPAESEYLYFRLVDSAAGRHYFSKTFDDHIRAGQLYLKSKA
jgi:UPF0755 protein